jgi:hypothetical protein
VNRTSKVKAFIGRLERLVEEEDRATLAQLRRSLAFEPGTYVHAFPFIERFTVSSARSDGGFTLPSLGCSPCTLKATRIREKISVAPCNAYISSRTSRLRPKGAFWRCSKPMTTSCRSICVNWSACSKPRD